MKQYLDICRRALTKGTVKANRTGNPTIGYHGDMMKFDMADGFPAVTTKKLAFKACVGEMLGFLRGYDNAAQFRALGSRVWDANANDPGKPGFPNAWLNNPNRKGTDDLGRIYGVQARRFPAAKIAAGHNFYEHLLSAQLRQVRHPSRTTTALAWHLGQTSAFGGNPSLAAPAGVSPRLASYWARLPSINAF